MKFYNKPLSILDALSYWAVLFIAAMLSFAVQCVKAQDINSGNLVTVDWLEKNITNANILLIDASFENNYKENHIQGAVNVNVYRFGIMETPVSMMEAMFQSIGVSAEKTIVIYDQGGSILAPRMFYSLYYHGFPEENLFILDGGLSKWMERGLPVTKEVLNTPKGSFTVKGRNEEVRVMLDEFLTASGDAKNNVLLEALDPERHYGELQFFDRGGHIPNALLYPANDFFNPDKTFKTPAEIIKMLDYYGINSSQKILTHCGAGVAAAVPFFVLKFILGYDNVKLFMESQMGWLKDERLLPFWTYDEPNLMRKSQWLQAWAGNVIKRYGFSTVSIIDVRTQAEYSVGHLPYSVNIPADVFKNFIKNPDALAELLGKNGINISHEVVIVSGAGITKESSLVFSLLEMLGQKKVSIFMDSMEEYKSMGYAFANDTITSEPVKYIAQNTKEVFINEKNGKGIFEDVYIASGENLQEIKPTRKIIHLNYKDFLNPDGSPKAAKDIWTIMKNAGLPRYARIICFSHDPAEAAVNYFIFRLMGFPDIKILII
jgi:thiosulfate/3-mercaptopyruvate sulfurtransferase